MQSVLSVVTIASRITAYALWQQTARHRLRGGELPRLWSSAPSKRERKRAISVLSVLSVFLMATRRAVHFRAAKKAAGAAFGISFVFVAGGEAVNSYAQYIFPLHQMRELRIEYRYAVVLDDALYKRQLFCILE